MPVITRPELRLAVTTGLVNGLASLSALPFGYYAPMAVLAMGGDSYGSSLELGRQRILGSLLGMAVLLIGLNGLRAVPMPLALALALGAMRWIGGALGLRVGYKVGGMIVVMGWLAHDNQLGAWVPLRLFWTVVGIACGLLSLSLFWPSRGRAEAQACLVELLSGLAEDLERQAAAPERQAALQRLRGLLPAVASELGSQPFRHPAFRLLETFEEAASRLLGASRVLASLPSAPEPELARLQEGEEALLAALAARLRQWCRRLERREASLPAPPAPPLAPPALWLAMEAHFDQPDLNALPPRRLERLATRLTLCRQALQAVETAEREWAALVQGPGGAVRRAGGA